MWPEESTAPSASKYFGLIYFLLILIPFFVILGLYFHRRNKQPIKGRLPVLSFLAQLCILLHQLFLCGLMLYGNQIYCSTFLFIIYMTVLPAIDFYLARGYILYFIFHVTQERLALASEKINHERQASHAIDVAHHESNDAPASRESTLKWFLRNRYRVQTPFLSACLVSAVLLQAIYPLIYTIQHPTLHSVTMTEAECQYVFFSPIIAIQILILLSAAIWIALKLKNIRDGFFLKSELRIVSALGAIVVVGWGILTNIPSIHELSFHSFDIQDVWNIIFEDSIFFVTTVYPLYMSYDPMFQSEQQDDLVNEDIKKLEQIINIVPGFESFRAFLTREFSVQNLLFYCDIRDFRVKYDPNISDTHSNTKTPPTSNGAVVAPSTPIAPASPTAVGTVAASPISPSRTMSIPCDKLIGTPSRLTRQSTAPSVIARTSSVAMVALKPTSTPPAPKESLLANFHLNLSFRNKDKEKEMTAQQLAEYHKKLLLTEANVQFEAQRLFRKYVAFGAPLQVNLPDSTVSVLARSLGLNRDGTRARRPRDRDRDRDAIGETSSFVSDSNTGLTPKFHHHSSTTAPAPRSQVGIDLDVPNAINFLMFNEAQQIILRLMAVDSFKRYKKSADYSELTRLLESDPVISLGLARV